MPIGCCERDPTVGCIEENANKLWLMFVGAPGKRNSRCSVSKLSPVDADADRSLGYRWHEKLSC
jgi:hypothetical protein